MGGWKYFIDTSLDTCVLIGCHEKIVSESRPLCSHRKSLLYVNLSLLTGFPDNKCTAAGCNNERLRVGNVFETVCSERMFAECQS